jgi:hypothetical protein
MHAAAALMHFTLLDLPFTPRGVPSLSLPVSIVWQPLSQDPDGDFRSACINGDLTFNPYELGFLPSVWANRPHTFGDLVTDFFRRKCSAKTRFLHKLFYAIRISEVDCAYFPLVGVQWESERIIKVDKYKFARLLGIKTIDGSLFHRHGNFPSHGFTEVGPIDARDALGPGAIEDVDFDNVRLVVHGSGAFAKGCGPEIEGQCAWVNTRRGQAVKGLVL